MGLHKLINKLALGNGKVIGEFVCSNIAKGTSQLGSCLSMRQISEYANGKEVFGWHISNLVIYDKPKDLNEFGLTRPPQSWCYVESEVSE